MTLAIEMLLPIPSRTGLDEETERLILWGWKHREAMALSAGEGFPEALQPIVRLFFTALSLFHRTSSLAECLTSFMRPYLVTHRGMPKWLLSLWKLSWNHREFQRGSGAFESPLARAGVKDAPSLQEVLQRLVSSAPSARRHNFGGVGKCQPNESEK
jgi:hypothetical protein